MAAAADGNKQKKASVAERKETSLVLSSILFPLTFSAISAGWVAEEKEL